MELRDYLRILHRNWILILALTILGGAGAYGYSLLQTPTYQAETQLYVSVRSDSSGVTELAQGTNFAVRLWSASLTSSTALSSSTGSSMT